MHSDTSTRDWLEGRRKGLDATIIFIRVVANAASRLSAQFVCTDSTEQDMDLLREHLETRGRQLAGTSDAISRYSHLEIGLGL